jgi:hypothetical protein
LEAAIPMPIPGCIKKNGKTTVKTPTTNADTNRVVNAPTEEKLTTNGRRIRNLAVHETSTWQMTEPSTDHRPIRRRNTEEAFQTCGP